MSRVVVLGDAKKRHTFVDLVGELSDGFSRRTVDQITGIALHHDAAFFDGRDKNFNGTTEDEEKARILAVHRLHTQTNGWAGIGYHLYVFPSGRMWHVGDLLTSRAHVYKRNPGLVGIVAAGDFSSVAPTIGTLLAYANAIDAVNRQLRKPLVYKGHREWAIPGGETACPGDTFQQWIRVPAMVIEAIARESGR